jgi:Txe/YoeB family toxin of Txe-Axe toxin-antitoxin module
MEDFLISKQEQENLVKKFDNKLKEILADPHPDHIHLAKPATAITKEEIEQVIETIKERPWPHKEGNLLW